MENTVLGNALEGVPEESEEEEQPSNPNIESANNLDGQYQKYSQISRRIAWYNFEHFK